MDPATMMAIAGLAIQLYGTLKKKDDSPGSITMPGGGGGTDISSILKMVPVDAIPEFLSIAKSIMPSAMSGAGGAGSSISSALSGLLGGSKAEAAPAAEEYYPDTQSPSPAISGSIPNLGTLSALINPAVSSGSSIAKNLLGGAIQGGSSLFNNLAGSAIGTGSSLFNNLAGSAIGTGSSLFGNLLGSAIGSGSSLVNALLGGATNLIPTISGAISRSGGGGGSSPAGGILRGIGNIFSGGGEDNGESSGIGGILSKITPIASALLGGVGSFFGAKEQNKGLSGLADPIKPYSGYQPPHVQYLRPVEDLITQTLMRRSQGQDVGYDPARREALLKNYETEQGRSLERQKGDLTNRLSGMGLSRNAAAYDELVGRAGRQAEQERNLYRNRVDVEDLERRNQERDINTGRLQNLNTFNFGQENRVADFERSVWGQESANELARRGYQVNREQLYQDPWESALTGGAAMYDIANPETMKEPSSSQMAPRTQPQAPSIYDPYYDILTSAGAGYRKNIDPRYSPLNPKGQNLYR